MYYRNSVTIFSALLLAACGGAGGSNFSTPSPVYAVPGPAPEFEDLIGETFPVRTSFRKTEDGTLIEVGRQTYGLTVTSPTTADLLTPEGTVSMTDTGTGWSGILNGREYFFSFEEVSNDYAAILLGGEEGPDAASQQANVSVFGFETLQSQLDTLQATNANANYAGPSVLQFTIGATSDMQFGTASFGVNFGTRAVTGNVFDDGGTGVVTIAGGQVENGGFTGTLELASDPDITLNSSDLDGYFYGPNALEAGGTFEGTGTDDGDELHFSGNFIVVQP